jgi:hypothetical protein
MISHRFVLCVVFVLAGVGFTCAVAPTYSAEHIYFAEEFADSANWFSGGFTALTEVASGGPSDDSYVSNTASFSTIGQGTLFRGHSGLGASNGAFAGNWLDWGVTKVTASVRHDASIPLTFFLRAADPNNSPAALSLPSTEVQPNTWTELIFNMKFGSPDLILEGPPTPQFYASIFDNVGNLQLAVNVPDGMESDTTSHAFDLASVAVIVPEPAGLTLLLAAFSSLGLIRVRR